MVREGVSTSFSLRKTLSSLYSGGAADWHGETLLAAADGKVNLVSAVFCRNRNTTHNHLKLTRFIFLC